MVKYIQYKKSYKKSFKKLDVKIKEKAYKRIEIFIDNPFAEVLNNHELHGKFKGIRSINITGDYRAIFRELSNGTYEFIEFIDIGSHAYLYG